MSLKDELISAHPAPSVGRFSRGRCGVNEWLKLQSNELVVEFNELMETPVSTMQMHRFLQSKFDDLSFSLTTFRTHRNKWCLCR